MNNTKYNGWTNYETWNCNLHFDGTFQEDAETILEEKLDSMTLDELKAETDEEFEHELSIVLMDRIKELVEEIALESETKMNLFVQDLINSALAEINYYEIAKHYFSDMDLKKVLEDKIKELTADENQA